MPAMENSLWSRLAAKVDRVFSAPPRVVEVETKRILGKELLHGSAHRIHFRLFEFREHGQGQGGP